jgi:hypothetical protein
MESKQKTPILKANPRKASMDNINLDTDIDDKPSAALPEPLLLNNEDRFVVFPLQHTIYGRSIKITSQYSGHLKRLTFQRI